MRVVHVKDTLRSAFLKVRHCQGRQWGGYLTPVEVLALIKAGVKPTDSNARNLKYIEDAKESGRAYNTWFYFYPAKLETELQKFKEVR